MPQSFTNAFECYEAIGQRLVDAVPEPWKKITVEFEIIEIDDVCDYCIFYEPKRWWRLKEGQSSIEDTLFIGCFYALARLTSTPEKGLFRKCEYVLSQDGTYKVNFEY